ncbi:unnamed protein product [Sphagnum jensenii]|uniref:Uncharacterized protein n=1 Tax=Sphagnum jensenii TaxID=128206 RepID=A0ABP1BL23_9BRYO
MHGCCCSRESRVIPSSIPGQQRKLRCDDPLMAATAASSSQRHSASISYQHKCKRSSTTGERQEETFNTLRFFRNGICKWETISENQKTP